MFPSLLHILAFICLSHFLSKNQFTGAIRGLRERLQRNPKLPPRVGSRSLKVLAGIYIESLGNFRAAEMSFDVDIYLYLSWWDPSLNHSNADYVLLNDPKVRHYIWLPDLYFANARTSHFHDVIAPNFNLFIDQNGSVAYSTRITLNVACNLDLSLYPMDSQKCAIQMLSYAYVESQVKVRWFDLEPTRYNPLIQLPEFSISNITSEYCDGTYNYAIMEHSFRRDRFSCLEAIIHLNRQIGYHMVQSYIPTGLIVMISWVSFWIDRRAVPARVTLSFTTLLSLSTLGNGLRFGLPQVAYAKAIDFWFGACMVFVFLSLLEFAAVNSYMREAEKYERFATYCAKKNSSLRINKEDGSQSPAKRKRKMSSSDGEEQQNGSAKETNSLVPSIDATPSEESVEAIKWSSAATIGDNIWLSYALPKTPPRWTTFANYADSQPSDSPPTAGVDRLRPVVQLGQKADREKKCTNEYGLDYDGHCQSASDGLRRLDGNPLATNHFLREGFRYSRKGLSLDQNSRWFFPLTFTLWNLLYWSFYLWYIQRH